MGTKDIPLYNRDLSWLSFNESVLSEAENERVPLAERIKFLAIFSSNLDEFYRVRVAGIMGLARAKKKQLKKQLAFNPEKTLKRINKIVLGHQERYGKVFFDSILPALKKHKVMLYYGRPLLKSHQAFCKHYFRSKILACLQPAMMASDTDVIPFLENRAIYFLVKLRRNETQEAHYAFVNIPTNLMGRMVQLPSIRGYEYWVFIDDIIRENMGFLFPGYTLQAIHSIKLNRDADLNLEEAMEDNLAEVIKSSLKKRGLGLPSRLLYDGNMDLESIQFVKEKLELGEEEMFEGGRYHNLNDLMSFNPSLPRTCYNTPLPALEVIGLEEDSLFTAIEKQDYLLHFPYQSYDYILSFFNEAAIDPCVSEIQATFYRVADNSFIANALISAARNGKKVTAFFELKARFDEENNLKWADQLKEAGVEVVFGDAKTKVHAKAALITRVEQGVKSYFAFLGTGNFNEKTAGIYTDHGLLTANQKLAKELKQFFKILTDAKKPKDFQQLLVPGHNLIAQFDELIAYEIERAKKGKQGKIIVKVNNLQSSVMIDKLYHAAQQGVQVELIVRGICCLKPGIKGISENIKVTRIVDRYLEHARIFYFYHKGEEILLMGSADWMDRNLFSRLEIVFPIEQRRQKEEIIQLLQFQLEDNQKAVWLDEHMRTHAKPEDAAKIRAQFDFYNWLKSRS